MERVYFDVESCGFHGPSVLIQYATDDSDITLHEVFDTPIDETLELIEWICTCGIVGFNIAFDWFKLCQTYTTLLELKKRYGGKIKPHMVINEYADCEPIARDGPCIKPMSAFDIMLHARKDRRFQGTMQRKPIRIRRIPKKLAHSLVHELNNRIQLPNIYFAKRKDATGRWNILEIKHSFTGEVDPDFVDVELKFAPTSALKALASHALELEGEALLFDDAGVDKRYNPVEFGWAPYALAVSNAKKYWTWTDGSKRGSAWPGVIDYHIVHWGTSQRGRKYAADDVDYLRRLYDFFERPDLGDDDSILSCSVAANRWRGFAIDKERITGLRDGANKAARAAPKDPRRVYAYVTEVMSDDEKAGDISGSTKKPVLEAVANWRTPCSCVPPKESDGAITERDAVVAGDLRRSDGDFLRFLDQDVSDEVSGVDGCNICGGVGTVAHPAAERAQACLDARKARNRKQLYDKLLLAGRFHAAASVIGTLSSRKAGRTETKGSGKSSANLNSQGIPHEKEVRISFPLAWDDLVLCGGDFSAFEISIADARYDDPDLRRELLTCYVCKKQWSIQQYSNDITCPHCGCSTAKCTTCGKTAVVNTVTGEVQCTCDEPKPKDELEDTLRKIHGLFAEILYPGKDYDDIIKTKGDKNLDMYDQGKRGVFAKLYGGNHKTLMDRLGIDEDAAIQADRGFGEKYKRVGEAQREIDEAHQALRQPGGIGSQVFWSEPRPYVESLTGFRRYFDIEYKICEALFKLAQKPPRAWHDVQLYVVRRDRRQKASGAIQSALYAASFQICAAIVRAASNHEIQSTGGVITKQLERRLWDKQPAGVNEWVIQILNVHDELMTPCKEEIIPEVEQTVRDFIVEKQSLIPLLKMDWSNHMESWAEK